MSAVPDPEDEEVTDFVLVTRDITEGRQLAEGQAEPAPVPEDLAAGAGGLFDSDFSGELQRRAEVSCEFVSGSRCSRVQG